jgi:hypothetical protein
MLAVHIEGIGHPPNSHLTHCFRVNVPLKILLCRTRQKFSPRLAFLTKAVLGRVNLKGQLLPHGKKSPILII